MRGLHVKFPKGKVVGNRYIVEELLGTGGFGAVYRVRDRRVKGNVFALKEVVDPDPQERASFTFECEILKRLDHHALPRVYRVFEDEENNRVYMLMDYIDGPNLEKLRLRQPEKRFSFSQVMKIMAPIIEAVAYLHAQHPPIIHRDIKPSNIIVPATNEGAVLVDFGIAKEYEQDSTTTAIRHCSPGYGAPEHYARGTNTRTDVYSLGATFYTLLTGEVPVDALRRMAQLSSKGVDPLESANALVPAILPAVADVLQRALAINSSDRFASVEEFWGALKACPMEEEAEEPGAEEQEEAPVVVPHAAHAAPTVPSHLPAPSVFVREQAQKRESRGGRIFALCLVVLLALLIGLAFGSGLLPRMSLAGSPVPTATPYAALTSPVAAHKSAGLTPTPTAAATPSPITAAVYPVLAGRYDGNISDKFTTPSTDSNMSLSQLRQRGAKISGYFSVGPGLIGNGNFSGNVTLDNKIRFLVPGSGGLLPLFFEGQIHEDGSISGTYCSYENNHCNYDAGGYGDWHVTSA